MVENDEVSSTEAPSPSVSVVEQNEEAAPAEVVAQEVVARVIPKRVLVRKSDAAIEVEVRDADHYDMLVGIHGVGALEVLS